MSISIFDISHIHNFITKDLTFQELFNCTLVSKHWNSTFNPILWKELYTYYSNPKCCGKRFYTSFFTTLESRAALLRNCSNIRTLKTRNNNVLRLLCRSACANLVELYYTADVSVSGDLGLDSLMDLMEHNPNIREIALRKIRLGEPQIDQEMSGFLEYLCLRCPSLTSVDIHLEGNVSHKMEANILVNLLKYKKNVTIRSNNYSARILNSSLEDIVQVVHQLINDSGEDSFEVRNLSLQSPSKHAVPSVILALLKKCRKIQSLRLDYTSCFVDGRLGVLDYEREMVENPSKVHHLSGSPAFSESFWESIIKSCQSLESLDLGTFLSPSIACALSGHSTSLRYLSFTSIGNRTLDLTALSLCPNLETFRGVFLFSAISDIMAMDDWTCLRLKELHIGVDFDNRAELPIQPTEDSLDPWIADASKARHRLLEQIGRLARLRLLTIFESDISYYHNKNQEIHPIIATTSLGHHVSYIGLGHGLEFLSELGDLEEVIMDGVFETFSYDSIEWMMEHWPKLERLKQIVHPIHPMPTEILLKLEANDITKDSGWMFEMEQKRPKLKIEILVEESEDFSCDLCRDQSEISNEPQEECFSSRLEHYNEFSDL